MTENVFVIAVRNDFVCELDTAVCDGIYSFVWILYLLSQ